MNIGITKQEFDAISDDNPAFTWIRKSIGNLHVHGDFIAFHHRRLAERFLVRRFALLWIEILEPIEEFQKIVEELCLLKESDSPHDPPPLKWGRYEEQREALLKMLLLIKQEKSLW